MNNSQSNEFLKTAANAGVMFYVYDIMGGCRDIEPEQIINFIEDSNKFFAELYGVTVEKIKDYLECRQDRQCAAMTTKKKRCANRAEWVGKDISDYDFEKSKLCVRHQRDFLISHT